MYEGLSVALIEAMSVGLPVLAIDCPGNRALINHNENGLLSIPENKYKLVENLNILVESFELRQKLGANARKNIVDNYSITQTSKKIIETYSHIDTVRL